MKETPIIIRDKIDIEKLGKLLTEIYYECLPIFNKDSQRAKKAILILFCLIKAEKDNKKLIHQIHAFFKKELQYSITCIDNSIIRTLKTLLSNMGNNDTMFYVLEAFEYVESYTGKKKEKGIYYTPSDVVDYIVSSTLDMYFEKANFDNVSASEKKELVENCKIVDLSCGTGIFLSYAINKLFEYYYKSGIEKEEAFFLIYVNNLYGIDISYSAVETTRFLLMLNNLRDISDVEKYYDVLTRNIQQTNALDLIDNNGVECINSIFSFRNKATKFSCIIGNPPYSKYDAGIRCGFVSSTGKSTDKLYLLLLEECMKITNETSVTGLILPLAISYNQSVAFKAVRALIEKDKAEWRIAFFDRSPDALFGDDVKTRNAILFRITSQSYFSLRTTTLNRWNSNNRKELFENINFSDMYKEPIRHGIKKLGNSLEKETVDALDKMSTPRIDVDSNQDFIYYYTTGYNWLSFFIDEPLRVNILNKKTSSTAQKYKVKENKFLEYALLCSTITYWLWMVGGDGFHVRASFINNLPYDLNKIDEKNKEELIERGMVLWKQVQKYKIVSVNASIKTINYSYICCFETIMKINSIIVKVFGLNESFEKYVNNWYLNYVSVERTNSKYQNVIDEIKERISDNE